MNALLFRTGDQSRDFAVILATNRPSDLDSAVIDRMDEAIEFDLPGQEERERIIRMYLDSYIARAGTSEGSFFRASIFKLVDRVNKSMTLNFWDMRKMPDNLH